MSQTNLGAAPLIFLSCGLYPPPMLTIDDIEMDVAGVHEVRSPTIAHGGHSLPLFHLS